MTQMKLSDLIGVSYQQVQKYEKGSDNISAERLRQIAKAVEAPITHFLGVESVAESEGTYVKKKTMPEDEATLLRLYRRIESKKAKKKVIELLKKFKA